MCAELETAKIIQDGTDMLMLPDRRFRFGPYELRTRTRELYKGATRLKLRPQPFRVLQILVERAGDVVTREELHKILWPSETFVDFEHGLNTSIKELRGVLNDSASERRYIETLPTLGYRLVVPVETVTEVLAEPVAVAVPLEPPPSPPASRGTWASVGVALALSLALLGGSWEWYRHKNPPQTHSRLMIAVLPLENLTGDSSEDYLVDGLTEEIIAQLGRVNSEQFGVIARTSAMHYKHNQQRADEIGHDLNVQYLLEGSVRRDGGKVRVLAQLVRVQDQTRTWTRLYERDLTNLFYLQGEIANEISDEIQLTLGEQKPANATQRRSASQQQSEAYDLYLKGLYFWNKRTTPGFLQAIQFFEQAVSKDANYAPAYAGLADCYALLGGYSVEPQFRYIQHARAAALRALQIDPGLPEGHAALALIVQNYDWDWQTAEKEFKRAIALNPSYATAHHWYAEHLGYRGRFDEAFRESETARRLDPLSLIIASDHAMLLYYSRQYGQAIEQFRSVMEMDPDFSRAAMVVFPYVEQGMFAKALERVSYEHEAVGDRPWLLSQLVFIHSRAENRALASSALDKLKRSYMPDDDPEVFVNAYLGIGNKDEAFAWLEKAFAQHSNLMTRLRVDPAFDSVRTDARFLDLLRRVRLTT